MKKIVITGATSFIGVHLISELIKEDCEIYAIVRPGSSNISRIKNDSKIKIIELEMSNYALIPNYVSNADVFYHLAWEGARIPQRDDETLQRHNYNCSIEAMKACNKLGCTLFIGSGSQAEYGSMNGSVDENYECNPNTEYGKYKLMTSTTLKKMADEFKVRFIWLRIFSIFGKYDYSGTLIMSFIDKMKKNEQIKSTLCIQKWDYLYIGDLVSAMIKFIYVKEANGIFNVASGEIHELKYFVEIIKEVLKSKSEILYGAIPYGINGPVNLMPNVNKITSVLGWKPITKFKDAISLMVNDLV